MAATAGSPVSAQNNAPVITSASALSVDEGSVAVATLTATDADGDRLTWSITGADANDGALFTLGASGELGFLEAPDYEDPKDADGVYEVTVQVSDATDVATADLNVTVLNVAPALAGPATASQAEGNRGLRLAAYTVDDDVTWTLTGGDAANFTIAGGFLRFVDPPDYENAADGDGDNVYGVTVNATDGTTTETTDVAVTVTDVEEPGSVTLSPLKPKVGTALTATLVDPDAPISATTWVWERNAGREGWKTIAGATSATYTPTAADGDRYLRATANYTDGFGGGKSVQATAPHVAIAHRLSGLAFTGLSGISSDSRVLYPTFDPDTLHYAARCTERVTLTATAENGAVRLSVNGSQQASGVPFSLAGLGGESDIRILLADGAGGSTTYTVHCMKRQSFPVLTTEKKAGATEDLIMFTANNYLIMMDNNGVPRLHTEVNDSVSFYFRAFPDETHPRAQYGHFQRGRGPSSEGSELVVLDKYFNIVADDIHTVSPLNHTDPHDFMLRPNGDYVLLSYNRNTRDLSFLNEEFPDIRREGRPLGEAEAIQDSAIQIRTPGRAASFTWDSWDHMAIEDCLRARVSGSDDTGGNHFRPEWGHVNSLDWYEGDIVAGFLGCNKVLRIDVDTGDVVWRVGVSNRSRAQWEAGETSRPDRGPAPLDFVNDPLGGFCGTHGAGMLDNGNLIVFDNGNNCITWPGGDETVREFGSGVATRAAEYAIDTASGEAVFQREYRLHESRIGRWEGHVEPMDGDDWLISWGWGPNNQNSVPPPPDNSAVQADAETGRQTFALKVYQVGRATPASTPLAIRALPIRPVALAPKIEPLEATTVEVPEFHAGPPDRPSIVVAFNRPVVDPAAATSSVTVTGATVAVAPYVAAGARPNAYAFTLTPSGNDAIRFAVNAEQACASGGVCTADGSTLQTVPAEIRIPGPVAVTFDSSAYMVAEGSTAGLGVSLDRAHGRSGELAIPVEVRGGDALPGLDFGYVGPSFGSIETSGTLRVSARADKLVEGDETITFGYSTSLPAGVNRGAVAAATVTLVDATDDTIGMSAAATEIAEGNQLDLILSAGAGITFVADQTIDLAIAGTAQAVDYTVSVAGLTLAPPYTATLPAGANQVPVTLAVIDDDATEGQETIAVAATRDGAAVGTLTFTIAASDQPVPRITVEAPTGTRPTEAMPLTFTLLRTGDPAAELEVNVLVAETGDMLASGQPTTAAFGAGSATATVVVQTVGDNVAEHASEVTLSILSSGASDYEPGIPQLATVTVADDDNVILGLSLTASSISEGEDTALVIASTGSTFAEDREIALAVAGVASAADFTLSVGGVTLVPPYSVTLPSETSSVTVAVSAVDDDEQEAAEAVTLSASLDALPIGATTLTIKASDSPSQVWVEAVRAEVVEGGTVEFVLNRTNPTEPNELPALTVPVAIVDAGAWLDAAPPISVTFGAGVARERLSFATKNDLIVQAAPDEVTITLAPEPGMSREYVILGDGVARSSVVNDDEAEFHFAVSHTVAAEGDQIDLELRITNNVTFEDLQVVTLLDAEDPGSARFGIDYTIGGYAGGGAPVIGVFPGWDFAVPSWFRIRDDTLSEHAETIRIVAAHEGRPIAAPMTITIAANDGHPDRLLPPELDLAVIDGRTLSLLYSEPLAAGSLPATGDFSVRLDGTARDVSKVVIVDARVLLTLASDASHGQRVEVDYTPGASPLLDLQGNPAPASSATAVETLVYAVGGAAEEGEPISFWIWLSHAVPSVLELDWSLSDGTALFGDDYGPTRSGVARLAANVTSAAIAVGTVDDGRAEADESFTLAIAEPSGFPFWARLVVAEAQGIIKNDGGGPGPGPGPPGPEPPAPDPEDDEEDDGSEPDEDDGFAPDEDDGSEPDEDDGSEPDEDDGSEPDEDDEDRSPPSAAIRVSARCSEDLCRARTGEAVTFENASTGAVRRLAWDFGDGGRSSRTRLEHVWSDSGFYGVTLWVSDGVNESTASVKFLVEAAAPAGTCVADEATRCLGDSRFSVTVDWWTADGASGAGKVTHEGTNETGLFHFFKPDNWELLVKVLDGCSNNGHHWVFAAAGTDLGMGVTVRDTVTQRVKSYVKPPGAPAEAITDVEAFSDACRP